MQVTITRALSALSSNVARGSKYEEAVVSLLRALAMDVRVSGGRGDRGVDAFGWWARPVQRIHVLVQCKALTNTKCGPGAVQAFEDVVVHEATVRPSTVGIIASQSGFVCRGLKQARTF